MPSVPRYTRQVEEQVGGGVPQLNRDIPRDATGGGPAFDRMIDAGVRALGGLGEIAAVEKRKADQLVYQDAMKQATEKAIDLQYNSKTGAMNRKGKDAFGLPDEIKQNWDLGLQDIRKNLHNDEQREAFERSAQSIWLDLYGNVQRHVATEQESYDKESTNGYLATERNAASLNYLQPKRIQESIDRQKQAIVNYAARNGHPVGEDGSVDEWTQAKVAEAISETHADVIEKMLGTGFVGEAKAYYELHKDELLMDKAAKLPEYIDNYAKRLEATTKENKKNIYDANMRQAMLDMFDGKMTLSEAQRRYRADMIDQGDYNLLEGKLIKPDYALLREPGLLFSDPSLFSEIRQAQLTGTKSPGEITRAIAQGYADKKISQDDSKYLLKLNEGKPPTIRDQQVDTQANSVRDFATRYLAKTLADYVPVPGADKIDIGQDEAKKETETLVNNFLKQVDAENAQGERIDEIAHDVIKRYVKRKYPEINRMEDIPHVVVTIDGKVKRLLNPDQKTKLKSQYKIQRTNTGDMPTFGTPAKKPAEGRQRGQQ